jgi:hypothetical protein
LLDIENENAASIFELYLFPRMESAAKGVWREMANPKERMKLRT